MANENRELLEILIGAVMTQSALCEFLVKSGVIDRTALIEHLAERRVSWEKTATLNITLNSAGNAREHERKGAISEVHSAGLLTFQLAPRKWRADGQVCDGEAAHDVCYLPIYLRALSPRAPRWPSSDR
jgi:hypothetical protein